MAVTIGEQVGQQNSYHGPFISSNGDVFTILVESTAATDAEIAALRATDPTVSFAESDSGNRPQMSGNPAFQVLSINVEQVGDVLYVLTQDNESGSAKNVYFAIFDMAAASGVGAWQDVTTTGGDKDQSVAVGDGAASACDIVIRIGQTDVLGVFQWETESDMGTNYERVAFDTKANLTTGAWGGSPAYIGSSGMGVAIHTTGPRAVYEPVSGRTHVLMREEGADVAEARITHTSISSIDGITNNGDIAESPAISDLGADDYMIGHGVCFDRGGTKKIRFPYSAGASGSFDIVEFDDAASPSYSFGDNGTSQSINNSVVGCLAIDGSTVHSAQSPSADDDLDTANDANTDTWTTQAESFVGTVNHVSINVFGRNGGVKLAMIIDDGGLIKYDEDDITSLFALLSSAEFPQQNTFIGPFEA